MAAEERTSIAAMARYCSPHQNTKQGGPSPLLPTQGASPCPQQHGRAGRVPEPWPRLGFCSCDGNAQQQTPNTRGSLPALPVPTNPAGLS